MNKKILSLIFLGVLIIPSIAFAQLFSYGPDISLGSIVTDIEYAVGLIFGAIAVICFLTAGILFLTAMGDAEKIKSARSSLIYGVIGVAIGIIAFSIVAIVGSLISY